MKIQDFIEPYMNDVTTEIRKTDWSDPEIYGNWLAQTYFHICHSTRLLAAAGSRYYVDADKYHLQSIQHAKEEKSHEKVVLADLKYMKRNLDDYQELQSTKNLYHSAYYLIERVNPLTMYGYVYFLELLSLKGGPDIMERALNSFGERTIQHLKLHCGDDVEHIQMYESILNEMNPGQRAYVEAGIVGTAKNYKSMVQEGVFSMKKLKENKRKVA